MTRLYKLGTLRRVMRRYKDSAVTDSHEASGRLLVAIALFGMCAGCGASLPKMNAAAPIEKKSVFLGTEYQQNGQRIDRQDMLSKLENEAEPSDHLSGHGALSVSAILLAGVGGGLVGWPLGQAAAGEEEPLWILAGIGAGLIVVAIPLAIVADNKVESAVDAHNARLHARLDAMFAAMFAPAFAASPRLQMFPAGARAQR